jgi:DNA-binding response OmpR family regulator
MERSAMKAAKRDMNASTPPAAPSLPGSGLSALRDKHILLADDEPEMRGMLRRALELHGCVVHEAENGQEAIEIAREHRVDVVVTDLWMPVMNGVELIEALGTTDCPAEIIVLSAHMTAATTEKLRSLGVFRMIGKAVGVMALVMAVREAVRSDRRGRLAGELVRSLDAGHRPAGRALVLVVDDEEAVRVLLRNVLTRAGYRVEEACDGEEAVEKALAYHIDLVITDLNMPRMNGQQAVVKLRRASHDCFIICMTGECDNDEIQAVLQAGAVKCFRKPFDVTELLAEVKRLDLIAGHRKRLAKWEISRTKAYALSDNLALGHRHYKRTVAAAMVIVALAAASVPVVSHWLTAAGETAHAAAASVGSALDSASRVEGYLQRDEARELKNRR